MRARVLDSLEHAATSSSALQQLPINLFDEIQGPFVSPSPSLCLSSLSTKSLLLLYQLSH